MVSTRRPRACVARDACFRSPLWNKGGARIGWALGVGGRRRTLAPHDRSNKCNMALPRAPPVPSRAGPAACARTHRTNAHAAHVRLRGACCQHSRVMRRAHAMLLACAAPALLQNRHGALLAALLAAAGVATEPLRLDAAAPPEQCDTSEDDAVATKNASAKWRVFTDVGRDLVAQARTAGLPGLVTANDAALVIAARRASWTTRSATCGARCWRHALDSRRRTRTLPPR